MIKFKLEELLNEKNKTRYWLAKNTNMDNNAINRIYKNKTTQVKLDTLDKICTALDCSLDELVEYIPNKKD